MKHLGAIRFTKIPHLSLVTLGTVPISNYKFEAIAVGWFNITLVVYDAFDNVATDVVIVEVYLPSIDILIIIPLIIGVGAVFAVVIILVKKKSG